MFKWIAKKVASAVPKIVNAVKNTVKSVVKKVKGAVAKVINALKALKFKFKQKANEMMNSMDQDLQQLLFGLERGNLWDEARTFMATWQFRLLDFGLKKLNNGIESVPWLNTVLDAPGEAWKWIADKTSEELTDFGNMVYDAEIPLVSDFVGSFTGVSEGNGSLASQYGAFGRGIWVKGVGGTIDGLMTVVTNPLETAEGISHFAGNIDAMAPKVWDQVCEYTDKNLIHGTPETRAEFGGQVVFEVATAILTGGGSAAAKGGLKTADATVDIIRATDKVSDTARTVDKISDISRTTDKISDTARAADKLSDTARAADKVSDTARATNKLSDTARATDNVSDTAKATAKAKKSAKVGESGVNIKGPQPEAPAKSIVSKSENQTLLNGDEWNNYFKEKYGADNVEWVNKTTLSESDRLRISKWEYPPDDDLYLKYKSVYQNEKYFDQATGKPIYPPDDGFLGGSYDISTVKEGTFIDRVGSNGTGQFFSPAGGSYESRGLPPFMTKQPTTKYKVLQDFDVKSGKIAPWFDEPGMGTQYFSDFEILDLGGNPVPATVDNLRNNLYIVPIE